MGINEKLVGKNQNNIYQENEQKKCSFGMMYGCSSVQQQETTFVS
jgi:hypothetical protein